MQEDRVRDYGEELNMSDYAKTQVIKCYPVKKIGILARNRQLKW